MWGSVPFSDYRSERKQGKRKYGSIHVFKTDTILGIKDQGNWNWH